MKYSSSNKPIVCMQTTSRCYKNTKTFTPKGVLWHSTGCNNPNIKRYVQPSDNASDRQEMLELLGVNTAKNDWNHSDRQAGLNCWIGKLADGTVTTVQTMPWNYKPWGCGAGKKGSCNDTHIQFEICEDNLTNRAYFEETYKEACEITAYLCKMYNLNPCGTLMHNGYEIPVILCHKDSYDYGMGSGHVDVEHWFKKYGKTMEDVRKDVAALMGVEYKQLVINKNNASTSTGTQTLSSGSSGANVKKLQESLIKLGYSCGSAGADGSFGNGTLTAVKKFQKDNGLTQDGIVGNATWNAINNALSKLNSNQTQTPAPAPTPVPVKPSISKGDEVKLSSDAKYTSGKSVPKWVINSKLYVRDIRANGDIIISIYKTGAITGTVNVKYLTKNGQSIADTNSSTTPTASVLKVGEKVKLISGAKYSSGTNIPSWLFNSTLYVRDIRSNGDVVVSIYKTGAITGTVPSKYLTKT